MKKILKNAFIIIILVIAAVYLVFTGVSDLTNSKDVHTIHIDGATEILSVEHSINGLLPIGTDHYYIGINFDNYEAYIIHASPDWFTKNFDGDGYSLNESGLELTSLVKKESDYKISNELASRAANYEELDFVYGAVNCFELNYKLTAVLKLLLVVLIAVVSVWGRYIVLNKDYVSKVMTIAYSIVLLGTLIIGFIAFR